MEKGNVEKLTVDELKNAVELHHRALGIAVGWYLRSIERADSFLYTPVERAELVESLSDVAITDAYGLIKREDELQSDTHDAAAEYSQSTAREDKLRDILQHKQAEEPTDGKS